MYIKKIINIVDSVADLNIGIWQPILANAEIFETQGVITEIWARTQKKNINLFNKLKKNCTYRFVPSVPLSSFGSLEKGQTVIVTHGAWRYPTWWGYVFARQGFTWIYTPHGMLEEWSLAEKNIKKNIYFNLIERRLTQKASGIRAVSQNETKNLREKFDQKYIRNIPNSIFIEDFLNIKNNHNSIRRVLFLGRLHHKKGIRELLEAWASSSLAKREDYELVIAGQDHGELKYVIQYFNKLNNIKYKGVVFNTEKTNLLQDATFFILPSQSEGLPSALLESLAAGVLPIISKGCNVPQIFEEKIGFEVTQNTENIKKVLDLLPQINNNQLLSLREKARNFFKKHFSSVEASKQLLDFYKQICQENITKMAQ